MLDSLLLGVPLYLLVLIGYLLVRVGRWPHTATEALARFVFGLALPALLFRMMSNLSELPPVDARLLIAYFGGCLLVFALGRLVGHVLFRLDGVGQSVFALGGVFSNNVILGIPLATALIGNAAMPSVSLVLAFNALTLWTLVTVSVEWARHGAPSLTGFTRTLRSVLTNPIVAAILSGTAIGLLGVRLPSLIDSPLAMIGQAAVPLSLISLGMSLTQYGLRAGLDRSLGICVLKLVVMPLVVWTLARLLALPALETQVVVMLASLAVGSNVYLMSMQFRTQEGVVASSMVLSTALSALSTPLVVAWLGGPG